MDNATSAMESLALKSALSLAALLALLSVPQAGAATFYTSQAAFNGVSGASVVEDFENTGQTVEVALPGFSHNGLTFTGQAGVPGPNVYLLAAGTTGMGAGVPQPTSSIILSANGDENILVSLDSPARAIGFDVYLNGLGPVEVRVYDGETLLDSYSFPGNENDQTYLGVVSDTPITAFRFMSSLGASINTAIDNIAVAEAIPEPASLAVLALGGLTLGLRRRRAA